MNPIEFKEQNEILLKPASMSENECGNLNVYRHGSESISCWHLSLFERIKLIFTGKIWMGVYCGYIQPPIWLSPDKPFLKNK